jgi:acetylornithine deacetylase
MKNAADDPLTIQAITDLARDLVRIPSVNPTLAPDEPHGEAAIAEFAREWLSAHGIRAWLDEAAPGRPGAVGEIVGEPGPTLVLCAHLDTVGTAGMTIPPFEPRVENGRLYGRGSYDMKGSAAAVMSAAAALASEPLQGRILVALVADEEYASLGAADFVRRYRADGCLVTEASDLSLVLAHKGFVWSRIVARGRAAHGSRWDLGVSAIGTMGRIITALDEFDRRVLRARTHPLLGPASMHCALISGGAGLSTYAPECVLQTERRTLPGETAAEVRDELRGVIGTIDLDAEVETFFERPPLTCPREAPVAHCVREAARAITGKAPPEIGVPYWMDAAVFAAAGIPTVNFGPRGAGAHEAIEWVDLDSLRACARILAECGRTCHRHAGAGGSA